MRFDQKEFSIVICRMLKVMQSHKQNCETYFSLAVTHLHQPDPLVGPDSASNVHEDMGVDAEHNHERNDKDNQEHYSEVSFLHVLGPPTEAANTLLLEHYLVHGDVFHRLERCLEYE